MDGSVLNDRQTPVSALGLDSAPHEVQEQFWDFFTNVPYIRSLVSKDRLRAGDLPRDSSGRIIVDVSSPHILEDMDYFRPAAREFERTGKFTQLRPSVSPGSEYRRWMDEEVRRCREGYVRESDGEWITGDYYFFLNYFPILQSIRREGTSSSGRRASERRLAFPRVWDGHYLKMHYLWQAREQGHHAGELASRGKGKAHPYGERVPTPSGWRRWGDIGVGDMLFGSDGRPVHVVDIPFDDRCCIYRIRLSDGREVRCSSGHLFKVYDRKTEAFVEKSVLMLSKGYSSRGLFGRRRYRYAVPNPSGPVRYRYSHVPEDPFMYGRMLCSGDGGGRVDTAYMINGIGVRDRVLHGMMSVGCCLRVRGGRLVDEFRTESEGLRDDFMELCRSLAVPVEPCTCRNGMHAAVIDADVFGSARPALSDIESIEYDGIERAKCVTVDDPSGLYLIDDFVVTHNSYTGASLLDRRIILGESAAVNREVQCVVTASEKKYLTGANMVLDMFRKELDFLADNTEWPASRLIDSVQGMQWRMGYKDIDSGTDRGTLNSVIGITSKDDTSKLRGGRGVLYLIEEAGSFPDLVDLYMNMLPSVEDGEETYGMIYFYGTAGDSDSDFAGMQELMYNPRGYNIMPLPNVYDRSGEGKREFSYFYPGYMNRAGHYDRDGNSDVTASLFEILMDRFTVKHNSSGYNAIVRRIAEIPITPQEAITRVKTSMFPVTELTMRLQQIDSDPSFYDGTYVGDMGIDGNGNAVFVPLDVKPIREYPIKDNKAAGAVEIFFMPEKGPDGRVPDGRYIASLDPVDTDEADTASLSSAFVLDLFTDMIVAEYTGRRHFADENYETVRRLCLFYNARLLYENNLRGTYAYFSKMASTYLLADTPEYLRDQDRVKYSSFGNAGKGVFMNSFIMAYADRLVKDWLMKPVETAAEVKPNADDAVDGESGGTVSASVKVMNLYRIRNRALLQELIAYNPKGNFDRVRSLDQLMLYRQQYAVMYGESGMGEERTSRDRADDPQYDSFFTDNFGGLPDMDGELFPGLGKQGN